MNERRQTRKLLAELREYLDQLEHSLTGKKAVPEIPGAQATIAIAQAHSKFGKLASQLEDGQESE